MCVEIRRERNSEMKFSGGHTKQVDSREQLEGASSSPNTIMLDRWVNESSRKELSVTEVLQQPVVEYVSILTWLDIC